MADVARAAGVSVATVSKVVNGRYGVAQATIDRVSEVIDELGYEASLGAQSLRSHRTNVLGILVAEFEPFCTELLKGVSQRDRRHRLRAARLLGRGTAGRRVGWERRSLSRLGGTLIDGAIIVTPTVVEHRARASTVVAVDPHTGPSGLPDRRRRQRRRRDRRPRRTCSDLGHRRIASSVAARTWSRRACARHGFRNAMADAGVPVDERADPGRRLPPRDRRRPRPASCSPDRTARPRSSPPTTSPRSAPSRSPASWGCRVPEDLSVVGFDNVPESALCRPQPDDDRAAAARHRGRPPCACWSS